MCDIKDLRLARALQRRLAMKPTRRDRRNPLLLAWLLALTLVSLTTGCPSLGASQGARTLPVDHQQLVVSLEGARGNGAYSREPDPDAVDAFDFGRGLTPVVGFRRGVQPHIDIGARLLMGAIGGVAVDMKVQLVDHPHLAVAIAPTAQFSWFLAVAQLPLLLELDVSERVGLFLSPRLVGHSLLTDTRDSAMTSNALARSQLWAGLAAGCSSG
jgi:hypothetical protein